jgi:hypothetical protein
MATTSSGVVGRQYLPDDRPFSGTIVSGISPAVMVKNVCATGFPGSLRSALVRRRLVARLTLRVREFTSRPPDLTCRTASLLRFSF